MGSFNTVCALSGLQITYGTKIKALFLTSSPYSSNSNDSYFNFNYSPFVRTLPISGTYDDYGRFEIEKTKENSWIEKSILYLFNKDAIRVPYGYNKYHSCPLTDKITLQSLINCSANGRLRIKDDGYASDVIKHYIEYYNVNKPNNNINFPTWRKVSAILDKNGLGLLMHENGGLFNAQKVSSCIVSVSYSAYENVLEKLNQAATVLSSDYDCKVLYEKHKVMNEMHESNPILMVYPKGYFEDPSILNKVNDFYYAKKANIHPEHLKGVKKRKLPVMIVHVREDVWNVFKNVSIKSWNNTPYDVNSIKQQLLEVCNDYMSEKGYYSLKFKLDNAIRFVRQIPFQTQPLDHFRLLLTHNKKNNSFDMENFANIFAETLKVEFVLQTLQKPWILNFYGCQDECLNEWQQVNSGILDIINNRILDEKVHELNYAFDEDYDQSKNEDNSHVKEIFELENWLDKLSLGK